MMKKAKRLLISLLSLVMTVSLAGITAFADDGSGLDKADNQYYIYVYSGDSGTFSDGKTVHKLGPYDYGDEVSLSIASGNEKPVINSDVEDKYYARGLKLAGHDNDEISKLRYVDYVHKVDGDASFTVAYGIKGAMVKYVVKYVDENGSTLYPEGTYYGMAGDFPVVSYRYVEGYLPDSYNKAQRLSSDESKNVFTFTYSKTASDTEDADDNTGDGGNANANGNGAAGNGGGAAGTGDGTNIGDNDTPAAAPDQLTIEDDDVPQTMPDGETTESQRQFSIGLAIAIAAVIILAIIALILLIRRLRSGDDDDDGYDDDYEGEEPESHES